MSTYTAIITGASRGFGKSLAAAVSSKHPTSTIYLLSRPSPHHTATCSELSSTHTSGKVVKVDIDFNDPSTYIEVFNSTLSKIPVPSSGDEERPPATSKIVLYNNHGTLTSLTPSPPISQIPLDINLNLTSCLTLSTLFSTRYPTSTIVNVRS